MTIEIIKGRFYPFEQLEKSTKILYLPCNKSQLDMAIIYSEQSYFKSYIYACDYQAQARDYLSANLESKISFILTLNSAASMLPGLDRVVVFVGSVSPFISPDVNKIVATCLKVKIPVIEVPHGFFQTGYNLVDDSRLIDTRSNHHGLGDGLPSISNVKLQWSGEDGFGYPRTAKRDHYKKRVLPEFTLITSNTNWFLYSMADKRNFFKAVFDYAEQRDKEIFLWCPHPAERVSGTFSSHIRDFRPRNLYIYGFEDDLYFNGIEGADDLIPYCSYAISTVSTCLLDYEIYQKKVNIFSCDGVEDLVNTLEQKSTFRRSEEISRNAQNIITGHLKEFDARKFDELLSQTICEDSFVNHYYLSSFI